MPSNFNDLVLVTDAMYQSDLAHLKMIAAEEASLRNDLTELEEQLRRSAVHQQQAGETLRSIGGDILWQAWVGRKRRMLNLKLANVMARKQAAVEALQKSFGKMSVSQRLKEQSHAEALSRRAVRSMSDEQTRMILAARQRHD